MFISNSASITIMTISLVVFGIFLCVELLFLHKKLFPVSEQLSSEYNTHLTTGSKEQASIIRPATLADLQNFKESTIEMKEYAEVPIVNKEVFVTGEVSLEKEIKETSQIVKGTVRKTEVDTENITDNTYTHRVKLSDKNEDGFYK